MVLQPGGEGGGGGGDCMLRLGAPYGMAGVPVPFSKGHGHAVRLHSPQTAALTDGRVGGRQAARD